MSAPLIPVLDARRKYLLNHPEIGAISPEIKSVNIEDGIDTVEVINGSKVELMATTSKFSSSFQSFVMMDNGIGSDKKFGDAIFFIAMPFEK